MYTNLSSIDEFYVRIAYNGGPAYMYLKEGDYRVKIDNTPLSGFKIIDENTILDPRLFAIRVGARTMLRIISNSVIVDGIIYTPLLYMRAGSTVTLMPYIKEDYDAYMGELNSTKWSKISDVEVGSTIITRKGIKGVYAGFVRCTETFSSSLNPLRSDNGRPVKSTKRYAVAVKESKGVVTYQYFSNIEVNVIPNVPVDDKATTALADYLKSINYRSMYGHVVSSLNNIKHMVDYNSTASDKISINDHVVFGNNHRNTDTIIYYGTEAPEFGWDIKHIGKNLRTTSASVGKKKHYFLHGTGYYLTVYVMSDQEFKSKTQVNIRKSSLSGTDESGNEVKLF